MEQKLTFTAYLKDEYSKSFDKLADKTEKGANDMEKDLHGMTRAVRGVTASIDVLGKKLEALNRMKRTKVHVDKSEIQKAHKEIDLLKKELEALKSTGMPAPGGSAPRGGGGWLGGMGGGFAIAGTAIAAGAILQNVSSQAIDATAKYQKFEAVLANTLGSQGAARSTMMQLEDFASKTPFQVDELTDSFVRLANSGFKPTLTQLTALGDLAASRGKQMDQLSEAIIDAQVGEFERLKEFGIKAKQEGDKVTFTFKEKATTVQNTGEAIRNYIVAMGQANGVAGSMAAISKTTGGMISNLKDNIDLTYKALGDRFKPEIDGSISSLNVLVSTIKSWVEIPVTKQLQDEVKELQNLKTEFNLVNTSENRRKEILEEIKKIQPDIIDGTKSEKEQLNGLTDSLNAYINKRREQIALETVKGQNLNAVTKFESARETQSESYAQAIAGISLAQNLGFDPTGMNDKQAFQGAVKFLKDKIKRGEETNVRVSTQGGGMGYGSNTIRRSEESDALDVLMLASEKYTYALGIQADNKDAYDKYQKSVASIRKLLGSDDASGTSITQTDTNTNTGTGTGTGRGTTPTSISGGAKVTTLNISIQNLVNGGFTIQTTTMKESPQQIKDVVLDALMTAVNDVNLVASN